MSITSAAKVAFRRLPGLSQITRLKALHGKEIGHFTGQYSTRDEAYRAAPAALRSTWDNEELVWNGIGTFSSVHVFDWPILFVLQSLLAKDSLHAVTDFGGHIGVKFFAYRDILDFPSGMKWQVVEVPAVISEGERLRPAGSEALVFFERLEDTVACDVLICSGSLQYADKTLEEVVARMPAKPAVIVLNKIPVSKQKGYFTLERFIKSLAYRIFGPEELNDIRLRLGYKLAAKWEIPHRDIFVIHSRSIELVAMVGETWMLDEVAGPRET